MFTSILTWVQTHLLFFLFEAAKAPQTGLSLLGGPTVVDLRHLHRFNREFWSLLQIAPDGMTSNPYHGTMVAVMSSGSIPPTGRLAWLESLALNPLLHLCYVVCVCTLMCFMLWSSEPRFGLYTELSLAFYKVTKLVRRLPAGMMIKHEMFVPSPKMIYGTGAMITLVNILQAYTPPDSHPWVYQLSQAAASDSVPTSIIPVILVVVLILLARYLADLRAVASSQRAEIDELKAELMACETENKYLGEANTDLCWRAKEKNVIIAHLRAGADTLTDVNKKLTGRVSVVEGERDLHSESLSTLRKEATEKDDKIKGLQDRVAALGTASAAKAPHSTTKSQTSLPPPDTTGTASSRATAGMSGSVPSSAPRNMGPAAPKTGLAAWKTFGVDDAQRQARLSREAASRAAEDAKNGITHTPVEPTFTTSFKQVKVDSKGQRTVLRAVKDGVDTTGTAASRAPAGMPGSAPASGPSPATPSSTTPAVTEPSSSVAPAAPKTPTPGPSTVAAKEKLCIRFQHGQCRKGDACQFVHVTGPVTGNTDSQASTPKPPAPTSQNIPKAKILCPYFVKGACRYGSSCFNSHVVTDKTVYSGGLNASGHKPKLDKANK